jgi:glycosyltransferase involved in cell wall biosynthesis
MNNNKSLKILLISSLYPTKLEPTSFPCRKDLALALASAGPEVTVISLQSYSMKNLLTFKKAGLRDSQRKKSGVQEIINFFVKSNFKTIDRYVLYRKGKQIIEKLIEQNWIPDVIHVHSYNVGELALWFHNNYYVPIVTSEYYDDILKSFFNPREKRKASRLYRFSSANLAINSKIADKLKQETGVPFSILPIYSVEENCKNISQNSEISMLEEIYYSITNSPDIIQASSTISQQGGICKVAYQMGFLLSQHHHRMTTFTSEFDSESIEKPLGRIIILKQPRWIQKLPAFLKNYFKSLFFTNEVHSIFKEKNSNPNCVTISHRDTYGADIAVGHSCHCESVKIKKNSGNLFWVLNPIHHLYLKQEKAICKKNGTRLIAISTAIADEYKNNYGITNDFVDVIPNGVDLQQFSPTNKLEDRKSILRELNVSHDAYLILFVGNEFKRKGLEFIIDALSLIDDRTLHLLVLGHADQSAFLRKAKQYGLLQNIHFLGRRRDASQFFSGSDLFIIPADYEPFGLVGIEAMSCGTPILATKLGGFLDYLNDGINGYFIKRESIDIAEKIRLIKGRDKKTIDEMSFNARQTAEQYSWTNIGLHYSQVIEKTTAQKKKLKAQNFVD